MLLRLRDLETGVRHRLVSRGDRQLRVTIGATFFRLAQILRRVEAAHLAAEARAQRRGVEALEGPNSALAGDQRAPRRLAIESERSDEPDASDDHTTFHDDIHRSLGSDRPFISASGRNTWAEYYDRVGLASWLCRRRLDDLVVHSGVPV